MKKTYPFLLKLFFSFSFTFLLIEGGLHLFPGLISRELLIYFHETPRIKIARNQGLNTKAWDTVVLERDDGGPELRVFKPFIPLTYVIEESGVTKTMMTDEAGFCNPPGLYEEMSQIDIITLGDSFTTCHAVDPQEIWTTQLSVLSGFSAYNLGKAGVGAHEYLQIFKKFALPKSPKIVIMNIYGGNDFRDAAIYYFYLLGHNDQNEAKLNSQEVSPTTSETFFQGGLFRYSYALNLGKALVQYYRSPTLVTQVSEDDPVKETESVDEDEAAHDAVNFKYKLVFPDNVAVPFNLENTDKDEVEFAHRLRNEEVEPGIFWAITELLKEFVKLSEEHQFVPVVTYTPSAHVSYASNVVFENPDLATLMPWYSQEQRSYLERKSQEIGFVFVDLTPAMQAAAQASDPQHLLYYRYDLHLTPLGHTVLAKALYQALQNLEIISERNN